MSWASRNAFPHGLTPTFNVSLHKNPFVSESKFPWSSHTQGRLHLRMNSFWFFFSIKILIGRRGKKGPEKIVFPKGLRNRHWRAQGVLFHFTLFGAGPAKEYGLLPTKIFGAKHGSSQLSKNVGHRHVPLNITQVQIRVECARRVKTAY